MGHCFSEAKALSAIRTIQSVHLDTGNEIGFQSRHTRLSSLRPYVATKGVEKIRLFLRVVQVVYGVIFIAIAASVAPPARLALPVEHRCSAIGALLTWNGPLVLYLQPSHLFRVCRQDWSNTARITGEKQGGMVSLAGTRSMNGRAYDTYCYAEYIAHA